MSHPHGQGGPDDYESVSAVGPHEGLFQAYQKGQNAPRDKMIELLAEKEKVTTDMRIWVQIIERVEEGEAHFELKDYVHLKSSLFKWLFLIDDTYNTIGKLERNIHSLKQSQANELDHDLKESFRQMRQANESDWKNVEVINALNKRVTELEHELEGEKDQQSKTLVKVGELESIFVEWLSKKPLEEVKNVHQKVR